jgi:hypothetical protein
MFNVISWEEKKMAFIATVCAVGTAIGAVVFSGWLLTQLFGSSSN